ncbi:MAG TPA: HEAT repeat domain-containing protein, partial [Isosphaeraceae bacterium]|nr:HEAT repeat domain-containing protein [Isosphaeraceae bacterium]
LRAERVKQLALAVLSDPKNATARGLLGLVAYGGQWKRPETVANKVKADEALTARLAEYNGRRARAPNTADAQWELALWCEQNGLDAEAQAHFTAVNGLNPSREAAWKRLGCKKVGGRWITEAQVAAEKEDAAAQKKADKHWKPLLTKWHGWLGDKSRRAAAEAALATVSDPRATPALWSVFIAGSAAHHDRAVQVLGQIDAARASRALATLAVFDSSADVRRAATETLRQRDPREFAGLLVALLRKPVKYEVRPVNGPGSPGTLFVEGKRFNVQRTYAPPAMPFIPIGPNDRIDYDSNGLPVLTRSTASSSTRSGPGAAGQVLSLSQFNQFNPTDPAVAAAVANFRVNASAEWATFFRGHHNNNALLHANPAAEMSNLGVQISQAGTTTTTTLQQTHFAVGQMMVEYQKAALGAQQQLAHDVAAIDAQNDEIKQLNGRVARVLGDVAGQDRGEDPESWRAWWVDLKGYAYTSPPEAPRPTVVEDVPLDYTPQPVPVTSTRQVST